MTSMTVVLTEPVVSRQIIIGVDTHMYAHVAVAFDHLGARLAAQHVAANREGYAQLEAWAASLAGNGRVLAYGSKEPELRRRPGQLPAPRRSPCHRGQPWRSPQPAQQRQERRLSRDRSRRDQLCSARCRTGVGAGASSRRRYGSGFSARALPRRDPEKCRHPPVNHVASTPPWIVAGDGQRPSVGIDALWPSRTRQGRAPRPVLLDTAGMRAGGGWAQSLASPRPVRMKISVRVPTAARVTAAVVQRCDGVLGETGSQGFRTDGAARLVHPIGRRDRQALSTDTVAPVPSVPSVRVELCGRDGPTAGAAIG